MAKRPDTYHLAMQALGLQQRLCDPRHPVRARLCAKARARTARRWAAWEEEKERERANYEWLPMQQYDPILGLNRYKRGNV